MRAVLQNVKQAEVAADSGNGLRTVSRIGRGLVVLVGIRADDSPGDCRLIADKIAHLRVFPDSAGRLNLSILDLGGQALVVSNFTLYGDARKGRRPSFSESASGPLAQELYLALCRNLIDLGVPTCQGAFGKHMEISLIANGPVTTLLDSRRQF
ncbi:MAG TPA: D-aminoacyl-tRNA deacylase [Chthonomonadales bacterium]|nr:D-aminoacyl-tRNA deacylase [Chthonomonadales bacterium]